MRKVRNASVFALMFAASLLLLSGCPMGPSGTERAGTGTGTVSLTVERLDMTRAITPEIDIDDFTNFRVVFSHATLTAPSPRTGTLAEVTAGQVELPAGAGWTVTVHAYIDDDVAASGLNTFAVTAGDNTPVDVTLLPFTGATDQGTFEWALTLPDDVGTGVIIVTGEAPFLPVIRNLPGVPVAGIWEDYIELHAGDYVVEIRLTNPQGWMAIIDMELHVYGNLTSHFEWTFVAGDFEEVGERDLLGHALADARSLIATATGSADGADVPTTAYWVPTAIHQALYDAIEAAGLVYADPAATETQLYDARAALEVAHYAFYNARQSGTYVPCDCDGLFMLDCQCDPCECPQVGVPIANLDDFNGIFNSGSPAFRYLRSVDGGALGILFVGNRTYGYWGVDFQTADATTSPAGYVVGIYGDRRYRATVFGRAPAAYAHFGPRNAIPGDNQWPEWGQSAVADIVYGVGDFEITHTIDGSLIISNGLRIRLRQANVDFLVYSILLEEVCANGYRIGPPLVNLGNTAPAEECDCDEPVELPTDTFLILDGLAAPANWPANIYTLTSLPIGPLAIGAGASAATWVEHNDSLSLRVAGTGNFGVNLSAGFLAEGDRLRVRGRVVLDGNVQDATGDPSNRSMVVMAGGNPVSGWATGQAGIGAHLTGTQTFDWGGANGIELTAAEAGLENLVIRVHNNQLATMVRFYIDSIAITREAPPVTITIAPYPLNFVLGLAPYTADLSVTPDPAGSDYGTITWSSSDATVATVSDAGVVTVVGVGTATITAESSVAAIADATATVTVTAPTISLPQDLALVLGGVPETGTLNVTVAPAGANYGNITWETSNARIATVSDAGVITATGVGTVTITAVSDVTGIANATAPVTVTSATAMHRIWDWHATDMGQHGNPVTVDFQNNNAMHTLNGINWRRLGGSGTNTTSTAGAVWATPLIVLGLPDDTAALTPNTNPALVTAAATHVPGVFDFSQAVVLYIDYNSPIVGTGGTQFQVQVNNTQSGGASSIHGAASRVFSERTDSERFTTTPSGTLRIPIAPQAAGTDAQLETSTLTLRLEGGAGLTITGIRLYGFADTMIVPPGAGITLGWDLLSDLPANVTVEGGDVRITDTLTIANLPGGATVEWRVGAIYVGSGETLPVAALGHTLGVRFVTAVITYGGVEFSRLIRLNVTP